MKAQQQSSFRSGYSSTKSFDKTLRPTEKEIKLKTEINGIEKELKDLPYIDLKVEVNDIEEVVERAIQDLVNNIEEKHELGNLMKQIHREIKTMDEKMLGYKKMKKSFRKIEQRKGYDDTVRGINSRKTSKVAVLKKLKDLEEKNSDQRKMISRFIGNICKQGKRNELNEKVSREV